MFEKTVFDAMPKTDQPHIINDFVCVCVCDTIFKDN